MNPFQGHVKVQSNQVKEKLLICDIIVNDKCKWCIHQLSVCHELQEVHGMITSKTALCTGMPCLLNDDIFYEINLHPVTVYCIFCKNDSSQFIRK